MDKRYAIVVSSDQIFEESLPMASLGETTFLDFLLGRIQKACPDQFKELLLNFPWNPGKNPMRDDVIKGTERAIQ